MTSTEFPFVDFAWIAFEGFKEEWLPTRGSPLSSGYDLYAAEDAFIAAGNWEPVRHKLGIILPPPERTAGWIVEAQVRSRSGLAYKHGLQVLNSPGTIDNDYRGELITILANHGPTDYWVKAGDRISQLVLNCIPASTEIQPFVSHTDLDKYMTERGEGGFGSTGR